MDENTLADHVAQRDAMLVQANLAKAKVQNSRSLMELAENWKELSRFLYEAKEYQIWPSI